MRVCCRIVALTALALLASPALAWKLVEAGKPYVNSSGYSVQFPTGWKMSHLWFSDESGATRIGPNLQVLFVDFRSHKKAFKAIKKESTSAMLPQELGQLLVADMAKERGLENATVLSIEPAVLSGKPGFRLNFEYKMPVDRGAVRVRELIVGAAGATGIYLVGYRAPVLYYYDLDVGGFAAVLQSFSIKERAESDKLH